MNSLNGVSKRVAAIYEKFYREREEIRAQNLYLLFDEMAKAVEAAGHDYRLHIDFMRLGELVRSYFLDVIRYKEYHFDPDRNSSEFSSVAKSLGIESEEALTGIDPLSSEWTELVHSTANINRSKVASYTAKWILAYKPVSLLNVGSEITPLPGSIFLSSINEYYALNCALFALEIPAASVQDSKIDEIIYSFRFRKYDEAAYFMILSEDYLLASGREQDSARRSI
jgi:hypothetical protein